MTEASYTAWDDKQYVWPPPDGWYEASDGKWWPQGYGPPQAAEESAVAASPAAVDAIDDRDDGLAEPPSSVTDQPASAVDQVASAMDQPASAMDQAATGANQALSGTGFGDTASSAASGMNGWVSDGPGDGAGAVVDTAAAADGAAAIAGIDMPEVGGVVGSVADNAASSLTDAAGPVTGSAANVAAGIADLNGTTEPPSDVDNLAQSTELSGAAEPMADGFAEAAPSMEQAVTDYPATVVGSDTFDAATSAATEAFGTGLMPPMADRPASAGSEFGGGSPTGFDVPGVTDPPGLADAPAPTPPGFDDPAAAAHVSSPPPFDHGVQQQAILDAKPKGSSRGWLFAIVGVLALLIVGAALFFAFGRDSAPDLDTAADEAVTTGPGSVSEPHPRITGVVVFYPDAGVEQRWIVEVLEPVRDVSDEFDSDDAQMLTATRIRVTNDSGVDGASLEDLRFNLVDGSDSLVVRTDNSCPPGVDDFGYNASVAVGDSVEGTVCWAIPSGDLAGLKLGIESSKVQGRVHIQLQ